MQDSTQKEAQYKYKLDLQLKNTDTFSNLDGYQVRNTRLSNQQQMTRHQNAPNQVILQVIHTCKQVQNKTY